MKTIISILLFITCFSITNGQAVKPAAFSVRTDGIYECREWKYIGDQVDNPAPAYFRFFGDAVLLFCEYENPKAVSRDSMLNAQQVFHSVLNDAVLIRIKENMAEDSTNVYRTVNKMKVTAYKYQKITGGFCYDILSERPNCLGKPNMKIISNVLLKTQTQNGDAVDDRYFKFVEQAY